MDIFVPSEDFLSDKVDFIKGKFSFVSSFVEYGKYIVEHLVESDSPPSFTVHLSNNESKYDWGTSAVAIDFSWYERYKPYGDAVIGSIIWVYFIWRFFTHLPGYINGVPGNFDSMADDIQSGHRTSRKG